MKTPDWSIFHYIYIYISIYVLLPGALWKVSLTAHLHWGVCAVSLFHSAHRHTDGPPHGPHGASPQDFTASMAFDGKTTTWEGAPPDFGCDPFLHISNSGLSFGGRLS